MSIIELKGIYTAYEGGDKPVIRDLSLSVEKGEFVVIGGPNGAGKTTLLESINGLAQITHGSASVCGIDVLRFGNDVRKKVGYVIQNFYFDPFTPFTVEQVVMMGRFGSLGFFQRPAKADYDAADLAMRLTGIEELAGKPIGTLSGGQQQKTLIAHNIAKEPEIMMLDEPYSNLDFQVREHFQAVFEDIVKRGIPLVMVSHAFDGLSDSDVRLVVMDSGRIVNDTNCSACDVESIVRKTCMVG